MDKKPIRIALVGPRKSGKTFVGFYLKKQHGFKKWALGDGVTRVFKLLYDWKNWEQMHWRIKLALYDFMIEKVDPLIWVKFLKRRLDKSNSNIVIDDVRYISEIVELQSLGFVIIRITAPEERRNKYVAYLLGKDPPEGLAALHEYLHGDETKAYKANYTIHNDTKEGTRRAIDFIIENLTIA